MFAPVAVRQRPFAGLVVLLALSFSLPAEPAGLALRVKELARAGDVQGAQKLIEEHRATQRQITPEWLAAVSWLARGASDAEEWGLAEQYARETHEGSLQLLKQRPLDAEPQVPVALGAALEVLGQVYAGRGDRSAALEFLREQHAKYKGTSIEAQLQKNLLLLSLEGKPFPRLDSDLTLRAEPSMPAEMRGQVVLFYFWAHWCSDCKRQLPVLKELHARYKDRGLVIIGPTRLYGYVAGGREAGPEEELDYIRNAYQEQHLIPSWMAAPVSTGNFLRFGVSTTPTLVVIDRAGVVRLYHPGTLSYDELARHLEPLLD